jgi:hypothetical protein
VNYPVVMPPLFYDLVKRVEIVSDPRCLRRMSRQPGKGSLDRFHNCWVWYCNFVRSLEKKGVVQMAKPQDERGWKGFINIRLSDADKEALSAADETSIVGLVDNAAGLLYAGYKLGFAYDKTSGSVQATLTCWIEGHPDYGHAISARHPDFDRALHSLLYKHFTIAKECWTDFAPPAPVSTWD